MKERTTEDNRMAIAIIGMAGRFPEARNMEEFYQNLKNGRDSVRPLSLSRIWNTSLSPFKKYKKIGFLEDIDKFDHRFFNILPSEAECMAPQHRIMLQLAYETIENAGYSPDRLNGTRTSVYMAGNSIDYYKLAGEFNPTLLTGNIPACISGRIARYFNFTGNAVQVDTACSSSLVALHMACQDILSGDVRMALCGGVNILVFPPVEESIDQNGITSSQGKCLTFSDQADGAGLGEGAACVLLKSLCDAENDRDNILAVIRATAVNQDAARSSTLTAPSSIAQSEVITRAFEKAGIHPSTISYIEAHGTGTKLGDPIEVEGLSMAFNQFTSQRQFCAISALKSNIGHCDAAAGILGVIKVLISLKKRELFPSLHVSDVNPYIDFLDSPLYPNLEHRHWRSANSKRRAGISAFGISGTNCHAILEEWIPPSEMGGMEGPCLFALSGHTPGSLKKNALALQRFADHHRHLSLQQISYTLNTGRKQFPFRKSIVASTHDELIDQLKEITIPDMPAGPPPDIWFLFGESAPQGQDLVDRLAALFPAYARAYDTFCSVWADRRAAGWIDHVFGYCMTAFLKDLGLDLKQVMGIGRGKDTVQLVSGKTTLEELAVSDAGKKEIPDGRPKWEEFIRKKTGRWKTLIWELAIGSGRYHELSAYQDQEHVFDAVNPTGSFSVKELLTFIGRLSDSGFTLNYHALYAQIPYKVELPVYQFEDQHCWIRRPEKDPVKPWIHQLSWQRLAGTISATTPGNDCFFVIYCDGNGIGRMLGEKLRTKGYKVCKVYPGAIYSKQPNGDCHFDWIDEASCDRFLTSLTYNGTDRVFHIHLGSCSGKDLLSTEQRLSTGLYPILLLAKTLSRQQGKHILRVITDCAAVVSGREAAVDAAGGSLHGLAAGIRADIDGLDVNCVDIDSAEGQDRVTDGLLQELLFEGDDGIISLRDGERYGRRWVQPEAGEGIRLEDTGVYLITGGASGIGMQVLKALSWCKATFIVVGRRQLPHKPFWEFVTRESHPEHYETIQGFLAAQENNARIEYFSADVSDGHRMEQLFQLVRDRFGPVRGIIHAAGIGGKLRIQRHTIETFRETLLPKVHGALNLYKFSDKDQLAFFISFSSHNAIIGAERESNYCAANAFLDSFSAQLNRENIKSMTIRWPFWSETGMGWRMKPYDDFTVAPELSLSNREGIDVFDHLLRTGCKDVLVAKKDPNLFLSGHPFQRKKQISGGRLKKTDPSVRKDIPLADMLTGIWKKILSRDEIDPDDNFFQMGGHSLLGLQVRNQIERQTGIRLEYRDIVENPTIRKLVGRLSGLDIKEKISDTIPPAPEQDKYPLSEGQKGIWLACQKEPNPLLYNISLGFTLHDGMDPAILRSVVRHLIVRHEILRTKFLFEDDAIYQAVLPAEEIEAPVEYVTEENDDGVRQALDMARRYSFDLEKAPLFKIWLIEQKGREFILFVSLHHIVMDGWSAHLFITQLFSYYNQLSRGVQPGMPSNLLQYKDYVMWEHRQMSVSASERYKDFWRDCLKDIPPPLDLPVDFSRLPVRSGAGRHYQFVLTREQTEGIGRLGVREGGGRFIVCLTFLQMLLYRYSGQNDFFIGTPSTLRNRRELEDQLGYYVNMLPLRCRVSGTDTFDTLFKRSCQLFKAVQDHQLYPFFRMIRDAGVKQIPGRHYLFDIIFSYEYQLVQPAGKKTRNFDELNTGVAVSKYDMEFILKEMKDRIVGIITYDADLFREDTIAQIVNHFKYLVDTITLNLTVDRLYFESEPSFSQIATAEDMSFDFE